MELQDGDVLLCTVDRILGTTVFVRINDLQKEGSIILSEIAPGRIRNLRDYVVPKKIIVCKVLRISGENINLSLRRVTPKEKKEAIEKYNLERSYLGVLRSVLKENTKDIVDKIKKIQKVYDFLEFSKKDPTELEKITGKENAKKILDILKNQKKKSIILKKEITFFTSAPEGIKIIKELLEKQKEVEIRYIHAGKYSIKRKDENLKMADEKIKKTIDELEIKAKEKEIQIYQK